ncbi:MAG: T9SS type A sorting domain-containing protein [Deferribacteres bacterium]|nr:T9SS type A sorting domain-containing protein [candidate division KSB1 bacterium]MCB9504456.1 T9SS type A sorting domain-containing protein [Deferribacteres bacterium]
MKKFLLIGLVLAILPGFAMAQELLNGFNVAPTDTAFWALEDVWSSDTTGVVITYTDEQTHEGDKSMRIDWTVQGTESWGGYTNMMRISPDSTTFDFSLYTHLSLWYYNASPSTLPGTVEFRVLLKDFGDVPLNSEIGQGEYWYSHEQILDAEPGWNQILLALEDVGTQSDAGFWLPGWAGTYGNGVLDLTKIKAYKFEFSINSSVYDAENPAESGISVGTIYLDDLRLYGHRNPVVNYFDTTSTATNVAFSGTGTSSLVISDNAQEFFEEAAAQFDWKVDANESWGGYISARFDTPEGEFLPSMNRTSHLSLRYNNLSASTVPGNVVLRLQIYDYSEGADQMEQWIYETNTVLDSAAGWHQLLIPLEDRGMGVGPNAEGFSNPGWGGVPGNSKLDWDKISGYEFAFSGAQQGTVSEGTILFDNLEYYGFKEDDFIAPAAVEGIAGVPDTDNYFNLVIWQDVPGESNEKYDVFASTEPITDLDAANVEQIGYGIARGQQTLTHFINYPLVDTEMNFYYAVRATDKAGNVGDFGASGVVTNTAKGVPTISLNPPANFAADGDVSEWVNSGIEPFVYMPSTSHVAVGSFDDDNDLTATIYIAIDNEYLYFAADVIDNVYSFGTDGDWWQDDAMEMFFGLFDSRKGQQDGFTRGDMPHYKLQIRADQLVSEFNGNQVLATPDSADYFFEGFDPDWVVEMRVKLTDLQWGDDVPFVPENGIRIPFDLNVHDADANNVRDGVLSFSNLNMDNSWQSPRNWSYTWIGNQYVTGVVEEPSDALPTDYALSQNYPNPFNPTTTIRYALPKAGHVEIALFNTRGQKIQTLVSDNRPAGSYTVQLDATNLSSGLYFYRIMTAQFNQTKKMILLK